MKSASTLLFVCGLLFPVLAGCNVGRTAAEIGNAGKIIMMSSNLGPTLTQSTGDHMHSISAVIDRDVRALFHDLDLLFMTERPSRLSPWHDR